MLYEVITVVRLGVLVVGALGLPVALFPRAILGIFLTDPQTIATLSEQSHTDTMLSKLVQFGVPDPNPDTNDRNNFV